jgi:hypothetical protein
MKSLVSVLLASSLHAAFVPDFKLKPDDCTVLMAVDAKVSSGLTPFQPGSHGKFFIQGWRSKDHHAEWNITSAEAADHEAHVLIHRKSGQELRLEVTAAGQTLTGSLPGDAKRWQRIALPGTLAIPAGASTVTLRLVPADGTADFDAEVHAVELIRPAVRAAQLQRAAAMRADTTWFQEARYGIMVHWTKQSMPRNGDPKPYDQAVSDFDVEAFADQMKQTGAGFVVFTTSHAFQYFPAPLRSLDRILPGRTSKRDLVADLADALARRGMKLMLYFHLGAHDDADWCKASGFWETDTAPFFNNWQSIISEVGGRYRERLAGWWFDDGSTNYYYRSAPWEKLSIAARAGFSQRLVGFNAWELNNPTMFHDYFTGEGFQDGRGYNELLVRGGNGRYPSGTHEGLQSSACLITEGNWIHYGRDQPLNPSKWTSEQLAPILKEFLAHRNVPIFNLEIYQEGEVSPASVEIIRVAATMARDAR